MSHSVQMPALGESVTEGTVTRWLKAEGDQVGRRRALARGLDGQGRHRDPVAVRRDPAEKILVAEDETAEVGAELAVIGDASEGSGGASAGSRRRPAADSGPEQQSAPEPEPEAAPAAEPARPRHPPPRPSTRTAEAGPGVRPGGRGAGRRRARRSTCRRWASRSPRAPSPAGSSRSATTVAVDEPLVEISTDKVDTEMPSPVAGHAARDQRRRGRDRRGRRSVGDHRRRGCRPGAGGAHRHPGGGARSAPRPRPRPHPNLNPRQHRTGARGSPAARA